MGKSRNGKQKNQAKPKNADSVEKSNVSSGSLDSSKNQSPIANLNVKQDSPPSDARSTEVKVQEGKDISKALNQETNTGTKPETLKPSINSGEPIDLSNKANSLGVSINKNKDSREIGTMDQVNQALLINQVKQSVSKTPIVEVSKIKPYGRTKYTLNWASSFPQTYRFAQDSMGLIYFLQSNRKIKEFETLTDFYFKFHDLMFDIEEEYSKIYRDIPTRDVLDHSTTWRGAPTAVEAIGHKAIVSDLNLINNPNIKGALVSDQFAKELTNTTSRINKYNYVNALVIAQPWEQRLMSFFHNWNYQYYFKIDADADDSDVLRSVHLNQTISQVYQYLMQFDLKTIMLHPNDTSYQSKFNSIGVRVPFVPVDNNFGIIMDVDPVFRDVQLRRWKSFFKDEFSNVKIENDANALQMLAKELQTTIVSNTYGNDMTTAIDKDALLRFLPNHAVISMLSRSIKFYCTDMAIREVEPKRSASIVVERMLIKYANVERPYIRVSEIQIICSLLCYYTIKPGLPEFTVAYWVQHPEIDFPLLSVLNLLKTDIIQAVADYFITTDTGGGWAGAGMSPVNDGVMTRHVVTPPPMKRFTTAPFSEPYYDTYYVESTNTSMPLQARRFDALATVLDQTPTNALNATARSKHTAIMGMFRFIRASLDKTAWIFNLLAKIHRQVIMLPLARPTSDDDKVNDLYYGTDQNGYPVATANTLRIYNELERTTWDERLKYQYRTNAKYPTDFAIKPLDALAILCSVQPLEPIEFKFPYEASYVQWGMSYALNQLQSDVVSAVLAFKQPFEGHSIENIRYPQLAMAFRERFKTRDIDPEFKNDVVGFLQRYVYPPLDTGDQWVLYWNQVKTAIIEHASDFGICLGLFYGNVKPNVRVLYSPSLEPYLFTNVDTDYDPDNVDVTVPEYRLRTGLTDPTLGDNTTTWLLNDDLVYIQVPIKLETDSFGKDFEVFAPNDEMIAASYQQPLQLTASGLNNKTYTLKPFKVAHVGANRLSSTISLPFKPKPIFMSNVDPITWFTQEQFINHVQTMYGYIETLDKIVIAEYTDLTPTESTYSAILDNQTLMPIHQDIA